MCIRPYVIHIPDFGIYQTLSMLPTYIFNNRTTGKSIALTNARLAYNLYRDIMSEDKQDFFAYSTFVAKVKKKPVKFLTYEIEFVRRYGIDELKNSELLAYLNSSDELAAMPKPLVLNVSNPAPAERPTNPKTGNDNEPNSQPRLF